MHVIYKDTLRYQCLRYLEMTVLCGICLNPVCYEGQQESLETYPISLTLCMYMIHELVSFYTTFLSTVIVQMLAVY